MYIPKHFKVTDEKEILSFLQANSFGQLVSRHQEQLFSTHLPFLIAADVKFLKCHLARQNPQWQDIENQEVLIIIPGPHQYISPAWYKNPGVPTWNYQAINIYGRCRVFDDAGELSQVVNELTRKHESAFAEPWAPEYRQAMLKAIIGIDIEITDIQCKYKLSQNRPAEDHQGVIDNLEKLGSEALPRAMRETLL
jgi:transcriptional regulator